MFKNKNKEQKKNGSSSELKSSILWRAYLILFMSIACSLLIITRGMKIQMVDGPKLRALADSTIIKMELVKAPRGNILSSDGRLLCTTLPRFDVHFDTKVVPRDTFYKYVDTLSYCLAKYCNGSYTVGGYRNALIEARKTGKRYFKIQKGISFSQMERIRTFPLFNKGGQYKSGLIIDQNNKRVYPFGMLAHRTLGYIRPIVKHNKNNQPIKDLNGNIVYDTLRVGLEATYDYVLKGEERLRAMKKISSNISVPASDRDHFFPQSGKDLVSTIDINIQQVTEQALLNTILSNKASKGCAIVMDVKTGHIKAIANIGYDREKDEFWESRNYAIAEEAEPGSTFKLATLLALFEMKGLTPSDTVDLMGGEVNFFDKKMRDAHEHKIRLTTIKHAFEMSSNVGVARLANHAFNSDQTSRQSYLDFIEKLKFDQSSIGFKGEGSPYFKKTSDQLWSGVTIPYMSIGYECYLTPLQTLNLYNTIANGGRMMKPKIALGTQQFGEMIDVFEDQCLDPELLSKQTVKYAQEVLLSVIEGDQGTAKKIRSDAFQIAGKTGTSVINVKQANRGADKKYRASFVGYFPADNPMYSCIVVVTDPLVRKYGGEVAAPVFKRIAEKCYADIIEHHTPINIQDTLPSLASFMMPKKVSGHANDIQKIFDQLSIPFDKDVNTAWVSARPKLDTMRMTQKKWKDSRVPDVVGMGLRDALYLLENRRIRVSVNGIGKVKKQSVRPGTPVAKSPSVTLELG